MTPLKILSPMHKAIRRIETHLEKKIKRMGVISSEGHLIAYLFVYAPCSIMDLNKVFGLKKSTLTSMLDRLEKRDLLLRKIDPKDRRSWKVFLKPKGKALAKKIRKITDEFEKMLCENFTDRDLKGFQKVLISIEEVTEN